MRVQVTPSDDDHVSNPKKCDGPAWTPTAIQPPPGRATTSTSARLSRLAWSGARRHVRPSAEMKAAPSSCSPSPGMRRRARRRRTRRGRSRPRSARRAPCRRPGVRVVHSPPSDTRMAARVAVVGHPSAPCSQPRSACPSAASCISRPRTRAGSCRATQGPAGRSGAWQGRGRRATRSAMATGDGRGWRGRWRRRGGRRRGSGSASAPGSRPGSPSTRPRSGIAPGHRVQEPYRRGTPRRLVHRR